MASLLTLGILFWPLLLMLVLPEWLRDIAFFGITGAGREMFHVWVLGIFFMIIIFIFK